MAGAGAPSRSPLATAIVLGWSGAIVVLNLIGAFFLVDQWWGLHSYAFHGRATFVVAAAGLAIACAATRFVTFPVLQRFRLHSGHVVLLLASISAGLFWRFRAVHTLLGDGNPLVLNLIRGQSFHPDSPLALWVHSLAYKIAVMVLAPRPEDRIQVAMLSVGVESVIAGTLLVLLLWRFTRYISENAATNDQTIFWRLLLVLAIATQGYAQLFFGYIENYSLVTTAMLAYVLAAWRALRRGGSVIVPGVLFILCSGLHVLSWVLLPSLCVLIWITVRRSRPKLRGFVDIGLLACLALIAIGVARTLGGYDPMTHAVRLLREALDGGGGYPGGWSARVRDVFNEHMLLGPWMALVAVLGLIAARNATLRRTEAAFASTILVSCWAPCLLVGDLRLGYPRDWDLLAPLGALVCVTGTYLVVRGFGEPCVRNLMLVVLVSVFHVAPWIGLNTSWGLAFERLKHLPIEGGRKEMAVGYWYGRIEEFAAAHTWLDHAIRANPHNLGAHLIDANLYIEEGRYARAARSLRGAVELRPSANEYRIRLAHALYMAKDWSGAAEALISAVALQPRSGELWMLLGIAEYRRGNGEDAIRAWRQAEALGRTEAARMLGSDEEELTRAWKRVVADKAGWLPGAAEG